MPLRRLSTEGRAIVDLSNAIARDLDLEYVGTEHILLAIVRTPGCVAARALAAVGVDEARATATIDDLVRRSKEDTWVFGRLPGTPHYRNVIEKAMQISEQLESAAIGSEHLLLALFHHEESTAATALATMGVTRNGCREEVLRQLGGP
jgi:ATP-dependent Clp protease ATP-binding subunit ClpC